MVESTAWNWEMVPKDDKYWNSPDQVIYYLKEQWQEKGFKDFWCGGGCIAACSNGGSCGI